MHGPLTLDESLRTGVQIARALEAAHGKGITHRDLKPANIQLTPAGDVKVLDFGLAKVATDTANVSDSPTTLAATAPGMIVGTVPYMSPEHVKGKEGGNSRRHLGIRMRALRDALRSPRIRWRFCQRDPRECAQERAGLAAATADP